MSNYREIYIFRCGATALYALTTDKTGGNLPSKACSAEWQFQARMTLRCDESSPKYELTKATLAAIAKHGFCLTHAAIHPLPIATEHNQVRNTEATASQP
jgi:hypothetical protein